MNFGRRDRIMKEQNFQEEHLHQNPNPNPNQDPNQSQGLGLNQIERFINTQVVMQHSLTSYPLSEAWHKELRHASDQG